MFTAAKFDRTLILMINSASAGLALGIVLVTVFAVIEPSRLTNGAWGFGTAAQLVLDYSTPAHF